MTVNTMSGKDVPKMTSDLIITTSDVTSQSRGAQRRVSRHSVVVAVTTVLVLGLAAATVLVGLKLYLNTTIDIEKMSLPFGAVSVEQEIHNGAGSSPLVQYHVTGAGPGVDLDIWVLIDSDKDIEIMRVDRNDTDLCTVTPLDQLTTTASVSGGASLANMSIANDTQVGVTQFQLSSRPINDKRILGADGAMLCANIEAYWSFPQCNNPSTPTLNQQGTERKRRSLTGMTLCVWDWTNCFFFTFPGDTSGRVYYRCALKCTQY